eukprot:gb/GECG01008730.1/.p1 GENE.gb/GECG01008730.1/~~gb/GECG01008730.1/.p1  ORF type:complete len:2130 (+),score=143.66 gb/GECG01008730.1/:1-6390(+)
MYVHTIPMLLVGLLILSLLLVGLPGGNASNVKRLDLREQGANNPLKDNTSPNWLGYYFEPKVNMDVVTLLGGESNNPYNLAIFQATWNSALDEVLLGNVVASVSRPHSPPGVREFTLDSTVRLQASQGYLIGRALGHRGGNSPDNYEYTSQFRGMNEFMVKHNLTEWRPRLTLIGWTQTVWLSDVTGPPELAKERTLMQSSTDTNDGAQVMGFEYIVAITPGSATASTTPTASSSRTPRFSNSCSTPSASLIATATRSSTGSVTATSTFSSTDSCTRTAGSTSTETATMSRPMTESSSVTYTPSFSSSVTSTATESPRSPESSTKPTGSPSRTRSCTPSVTSSSSVSPSPTMRESSTATSTATVTATGSRSCSSTISPTSTNTGSTTKTRSSSASPTETTATSNTATSTRSRPGTSVSWTSTGSPTATVSATLMATCSTTTSTTNSATLTVTVTSSASPSGSSTVTLSSTGSPTASATSSVLASPSTTMTVTPTPTQSCSSALSPTPSTSSTNTGSPTPSPTWSRTISPTGTENSSSTASVSITISATTTVSQTSATSRTSSMSSTATESPSPTPSRTPSVSPTGIMTRSCTSTHSVTGSTSTVSPTSSATVTPIVSASVSHTCTPSPTDTASSTGSRTVTVTPTRLFPVKNGSALKSACGTVHRFNCASIEYKQMIEVRLEVSDSRLEVAHAQVDVQSSMGTHTEFALSCVLHPELDTDVDHYVGCSDLDGVKTTGLSSLLEVVPVITREKECTNRNAVDACSKEMYNVTVRIHPNASNSLEQQLRYGTDVANGYTFFVPFSLSIVLGREVVVETEQLAKIHMSVAMVESMVTVERPLVRVFPSELLVNHSRYVGSQLNVSHTMRIQAKGRTNWIWSVSSSLEWLIRLPVAGKVLSEPVTVSQDIVFHTGLASPGVTSGFVFLSVRQRSGVMDSISIPVRLWVFQGELQVDSSTVSAERSSQEPPVLRFVRLYNAGTHVVNWNATVTSANGSISHRNTWLQVETSGQIGAGEERSALVTLFARNTDSLGIFTGWIRFDTDAWEVRDSVNHAQKRSFQKRALLGVVHVRVEFLVTSVFLCNQFSDTVLVRPHETKHLAISLVNTEFTSIEVRAHSFLLDTLNESRIDGSPPTSATFPLGVYTVEGGARLSPWLLVSPLNVSLRRGASRTLEFTLEYASPFLSLLSRNSPMIGVTPGLFAIEFDLDVELVASHPRLATRHGTVHHSLAVEFVPGVASSQNSEIALSSRNASVGKTITGRLMLNDDFGFGPANAVYVESIPVSTVHVKGLLTVDVKVLNSRQISQPVVFLPDRRLTTGSNVTELVFSLECVGVGQVRLDILIGGNAIDGMPTKITSAPIQCSENEVPDQSGTSCLCKDGYRRAEFKGSQCVPCGEGTFQSRSNSQTCQPCAEEMFSMTGASSCYACPNSGVSCRYGVLRLLPGYWCDTCSQENMSRSKRIDWITSTALRASAESTSLLLCESPSACIVNATAFSTKCAKGHEGPVCGTCQEGHLKMLSGECVPCHDERRAMITTALSGTFVLIGVASIAIHSAKESAWEKEAKTDRESQAVYNPNIVLNPVAKLYAESNPPYVADKKNNRIDVSNDSERALLIYSYYTRNGQWESLKRLLLMLVDYLQVSSILQQLEIKPFSDRLGWIESSSEASSFNPSDIPQIRCATGTSLYEIALSVMISPLPVSAFILILHVVIEAVRSKGKFRRHRFVTDSILSLITVLDLLHVAVTEMTFRSLDVREQLLLGSRRSALDVTLRTSDAQFGILQIASFASLFLFVFALPLSVSVFLLWWYSRAKTAKLFKEFLKFVGGFRLKMLGFLWKPFTLIRKLLLLVVSVFVEGPLNQLVWASAILLMSYIGLSLCRPYREPSLNLVEGLLILVSAGNCYIGILLFPFDDSSNLLVSITNFSAEILSILLQVLYGFILVVVASRLVPGAFRKLKDVIARNVRPVLLRLRVCKRCWLSRKSPSEFRFASTSPVMPGTQLHSINPLAHTSNGSKGMFQNTTMDEDRDFSISSRPTSSPSGECTMSHERKRERFNSLDRLTHTSNGCSAPAWDKTTTQHGDESTLSIRNMYEMYSNINRQKGRRSPFKHKPRNVIARHRSNRLPTEPSNHTTGGS